MLKNILNQMVIKAHAQRTISEDPLQKFKYRMTIPGLPVGIGFQKISGLTHEVGTVEYEEGGYDHTHKLPGRPKVGEVTAERGSYADASFHTLMKKTLTDKSIRNTIIIEHLNRFGEAVRVYKLAEAWVNKWESSDFDASSDDVAIEKLTIQFEYYLD